LEHTIPPYKVKNVKRKGNKRLLRLLYIFFFLIALIAFFNSSISKVDTIHINGIDLLSRDEILKKAELNVGMQYLFVRATSVEEKLIALEEIKKVKITKKFPGKINIDIVEQEPIAFLYRSNKEWLPLLENGYLVPKYNGHQYMDRLLITKWKDMDKLPKLVEEINKVYPSVLEQISEIQQNPQLSDESRLLIIMDEGYKIHVTLKNMSEKLNLYPTILKNLKEKNPNLGNIYLLDSMRFEEFTTSEEE